MEAFTPTYTEARILCCSCGITIAPNPSNMCVNCIRGSVDITESIPKQGTIHFCRSCNRYLQPPNYWVQCELESRELLALCLKKLKGLSKVRLVDAGFVWTEPHSRRVKVKIAIQKEVFASTVLQQDFVVEFIVSNQQCSDCCKVMAQNTWQACVQLRQKVNHKRTFFYLEQLILKYNAHKDTLNIKESKDGLDFFFAQRGHGLKFVEFLYSMVPVRSEASKQLISTDIHTSTCTYKFSYSVNILPICKDDLVCLPKKIAKSLGDISPLLVCSRVGNALHFIDPNTLNVAEVTCPIYERTPFTSLANVTDMTEYCVLDVELLGPQRGKYALADIQVARTSDFGKNDTVFFARSHLGRILNPGDYCMGYDIAKSNFNHREWDALDSRAFPDVILIKKAYPNHRKKNKARKWKLKSLSKDVENIWVDDSKAKSKQAQQQAEQVQRDYELFLRDLEEDPEMRSHVNLYKDTKEKEEHDMMTDGEPAEDDFPEIPLEELMEDLRINDGERLPGSYPLQNEDEEME